MRLLLDTHAFLWAAARPERLGQQEALVADPSTTRLLSAASSWEIAIKHALGKLVLPEAAAAYVPEVMRRLLVEGLPVEHAHALAVADLPEHHRDPFDRLLVAQAQQLGVPILSADPAFAAYDVEVLVP
ncbi:MAG TPA: type II toxin-antitoxin system VapC family toxin [Acidimicrobiales bacterium]|nr:type II toxin-antitoxin system VapC family toxin [Acidimicrobiales bacterium]